MTTVSIDSPAVIHGLGLFETMLVLDGRVVQLEAHRARLERSCRALGFPPPDPRRFQNAIDEAVGACRLAEAALRCVYVAGETNWREPSAWSFSASANRVPALTLARRAEARAIMLEPSLCRSLPEHKLTSYAICRLALKRAEERGANEALFLDRDGAVLEGTATNVFATAGNRLVTTPTPAGILPGIVRDWVLDASARLGIDVELRAPSREELRGGAFLTSSLTMLAPLVSLDDADCDPPGDLFARLAERWQRELHNA